jgi:hypothetical protein
MRGNRDYDIWYHHAVEQHDGSYRTKFGDIRWYNEAGERHRDDGPAVVFPDGDVAWCLNGRQYRFNEWLIEMNKTDEEKMLLRLQYA